MNLSILINYFIANSRASFYNVSGNQEIMNTALLTGAVSENPLLNYLIIENKAKIEGDKFIASAAATASVPVVNIAADEGTKTNTKEQTKGAPTEETAKVNLTTLETVEAKILEGTNVLKEEIARISDKNKSELEKIVGETLKPKIESLEKSNADLNIAIQEIKGKLEVISKAFPISDSTTASDQKSPAKNVKR
ncbi:hypothetical protein [Flavobacterium sp. LC2016-01]|uniref:hypothetical protein n=1 Tax=Flavobacterium sp. LC2016-01 TaxID=2675876 RepID=UPI0012BABABE|nr:hypothetical protein [Flavobacterium sp. LC2016-01]MTH16635.1 hypothetical protein [Flavobacterium sp. LC2016-01]